MITTVTLNPCVDHTLFVETLRAHETNRVSALEVDAGGKGINASRVIAGLGGKTLATGFLGGSNGAFVRHVLDREGVPYDFTAIAGETRINFEVEDRSGLPPTCFNEPGPTVTAREVNEYVRSLRNHLSAKSWLLVAGSLPQGLGAGFFGLLGALAHEHSIRFAVDADGENLRTAIRSAPAVVKPNVAEAEALLGKPLNSVKQILDAAATIRKLVLKGRPPFPPVVIISRGADGAVMADHEGLWLGVTPRVAVRSTVGSGDSMLAAFLHGLEQGMSNENALALGMAAGAATATRAGSGLATLRETNELLPLCRVEPAVPVLA